jgi:hypothetical protein
MGSFTPLLGPQSALLLRLSVNEESLTGKTQYFDIIGYKRLSGAEARIDSVALCGG